MAIEVSSSSSQPVIMAQETFDPVIMTQKIYTWFREAGKTEKFAKVVLNFTLDKELKKTFMSYFYGPVKKNICDGRYTITLNYLVKDTKGPDVQGIILEQLQKIKSVMDQHKKSASSFTFTLTGHRRNPLGSPYMNQEWVWNIIPK